MLLHEVYVLRVDLEATIPRVWRHIVVSPFAKLGGLHRVIAAAMGWDENLPHHFVLCGDLRDRVSAGEILDSKRERNWRLDSASMPADWRYPRCLGGDGACPPGAKKPFTVASANRRIWKAVPKR